MRNKLEDEDLLELLQRKEDASSHYVHGELASAREQAMREYHRMPYGNEINGESNIVSSDVQDSVEWILPALLKTFSATDKAVAFEPSTAADVKGAEQATDACNYVFYKQNNGFLTLYTAIKDMLTVRNCAVMWRKEDQKTISSMPFKGASEDMLSMLMQEKDTEIESATPAPILNEQGQPQIDPMTGQPLMGYNGRIKRTETRQIVKVEAFSPENLLIERDWTSPLLHDCPYVCRLMRVTLSDLKMMGYDVEPEELRASDAEDYQSGDDAQSSAFTQDVRGLTSVEELDQDDDAMAEGWLRMEFVLADRDGDGIAERLCVYRLRDKILKAEVVSHVPIATASPMLNTHRWDGMSIADAVTDLQRLHTELLRQTLNNLYLTNNPRTKVLTDANWSPLANIDDLLDSRAGGVIRQRDVNAISEQVIPFSAGASLPMLEYVQAMRENRTGVSRTSMGMNPDSLNNTATGRAMDMSASMQRVELIARIIAETLVKPIFQGILKVLTDGGMEKMAFRLRDEFVEYDPNEWRDQYDMTINVGLGTGDSQQRSAQLMMIGQIQQQGMAVGLATPKHLYNTAAKLVENAGFKDVQNFLQDPSTLPPQPQQPPIELQIEQMKQQAEQQKMQATLQAEIQKFQAESQITQQLEQMKAQAKLQEVQANLELQSSNDQRDAERAQMQAQLDAQLEQMRIASQEQIEAVKAELARYKTDADNRTKIIVAKLGKQGGDEQIEVTDDGEEQPNPTQALMLQMAQSMQLLAQAVGGPKQIIRDETGRAVGVAPITGA